MGPKLPNRSISFVIQFMTNQDAFIENLSGERKHSHSSPIQFSHLAIHQN